MARVAQAWLLGLIASCAVARAEPVERRSTAALYVAASAAFDELRYGDAVGLLDQAWRRGDSDPMQLRAIFALAGRAAASMGKQSAAQLWFQRWLCIEPTAELPTGASPKLQVLLSRARDALGGAALSVRAVRLGDGVELTIRDPLALAASVRADGTRTRLSSARVTLAVTHGDIELLDTYGNVLSSTAIEPSPPPPIPPATPPVVAHEPRWHQRWTSWALVAGGFATISVASWWIADDADDRARESGDESEEDDLRRRRDVATWISRGALVGVGIAITAGIVVYVRGREHRITAAPQPGGGGLAWRVRF